MSGVAAGNSLPLGQGYFRTVTHDYYRRGTVTTFAALDYLSGKVISQVAPRAIGCQVAQILEETRLRNHRRFSIHLIVDNYSTHKHKRCAVGADAIRAFICTSHPQRFLDEHGRAVLPRSKPISHIAWQPMVLGSLTPSTFTSHNITQTKRYVWHADGQEYSTKYTEPGKRPLIQIIKAI